MSWWILRGALHIGITGCGIRICGGSWLGDVHSVSALERALGTRASARRRRTRRKTGDLHPATCVHHTSAAGVPAGVRAPVPKATAPAGTLGTKAWSTRRFRTNTETNGFTAPTQNQTPAPLAPSERRTQITAMGNVIKKPGSVEDIG